MAVFQGTATVKYINMKERSTGDPIDISGWTLRAQLRDTPSASTALAELTTENGGFVLVDEVNGRMALVLDDAITELLPVGRIHFDVLRENAPEGPQWIFGGSFLVRQAVTR